MTILQESRLSMYFGFKDFQVGYTTITNALPNYSANSTIFLNTIPLIQNVAEQQKMSKKGIAVNKNLLKENLIVITADYARKLSAYAKFTNNTVLAKEVSFTVSKLKQAPDTAVKDYAQIVYDRAQPIAKILAPYGITAASQTELLTAITNYNNTIGKPVAGKVELSQYTKQLVELFKTAENALANMDLAVEIVRLTQPNFYNGYKSARKVIVMGTGTLSVNGLVTDATSGEPIKGATVLFSLENANALTKGSKSLNTSSVTKKTADKGGFKIKSLPAGTYNATVKKVGYTDQIVTVYINDGEMSEVNVSIAKN